MSTETRRGTIGFLKTGDIAHRDECNQMIAARMKTYTTGEMLQRLAEYDCPAGPVYTMARANKFD